MVTARKLYTFTAYILFLLVVILSGCRPATLTLEPITDTSNQRSLTPTVRAFIKACEDPVKITTPGPSYGLPGSLVYSSSGSFHLIGGTPLVDRRIPISESSESIAGMAGFSPNGEWFAYYTGSAYQGRPYRLHLISTRGDETTTIPEYEIVPGQKGSYDGALKVRWITNDYMLASISDPVENYSARTAIAIIDPFTGKWYQSLLDGLPARDSNGGVAFDATFKRVLYVALLENEAGFQIPTMVLWDLEHRTELWRGDLLYPSGLINRWGGSAAWSPDSSVVAFVGPERPEPGKGRNDDQGIYILDRDAIELRLITDFLSTYESFVTDELSWSPDGRYLVFRLVGRTESEAKVIQTIYLYDSVTEQVVELCPIYATGFSATGALVWSPDSRYLAYASGDFPPRSLNVVDLHTGEVVTVAESIGEMGGWSGVWP